jgi:hypothetical protein
MRLLMGVFVLQEVVHQLENSMYFNKMEYIGTPSEK